MSADLVEWDVTILMATTTPEGRQTRPFRLRLPAINSSHAYTAANAIGIAVNEATGYAWKITDDVDVRRVEAKKAAAETGTA